MSSLSDATSARATVRSVSKASSGIVAPRTTSPSRSSAAASCGVGAEIVQPKASLPVEPPSDAPMSSASSAICVALRRCVPLSAVRVSSFESPARSAGSSAAPPATCRPA